MIQSFDLDAEYWQWSKESKVFSRKVMLAASPASGPWFSMPMRQSNFKLQPDSEESFLSGWPFKLSSRGWASEHMMIHLQQTLQQMWHSGCLEAASWMGSTANSQCVTRDWSSTQAGTAASLSAAIGRAVDRLLPVFCSNSTQLKGKADAANFKLVIGRSQAKGQPGCQPEQVTKKEGEDLGKQTWRDSKFCGQAIA
jgi:hypothetical protein